MAKKFPGRKKTNKATAKRKKTAKKPAIKKKTAAKKTITRGKSKLTKKKTTAKTTVKTAVKKKTAAKKPAVRKKTTVKKTKDRGKSKLIKKKAIAIKAVKSAAKRKTTAKKSAVKQKTIASKAISKKKTTVAKTEVKKVTVSKAAKKSVFNKEAFKSPSITRVEAIRRIKGYGKKDLLHFRNIIIEKREEILEDLQSLKEQMLDPTTGEYINENSPYSLHMAEQGTDAMEREKTFLYAQRENKFLGYLDDALKRIDSGAYGICIECIDVRHNLCETCPLVPKARLEAVPHTQHCLPIKQRKGGR